MSQYVTDTGGNPETEVKRLAADLKDRIDQHKARKGEDRSRATRRITVIGRRAVGVCRSGWTRTRRRRRYRHRNKRTGRRRNIRRTGRRRCCWIWL